VGTDTDTDVYILKNDRATRGFETFTPRDLMSFSTVCRSGGNGGVNPFTFTK
jgi:hypothetical protein